MHSNRPIPQPAAKPRQAKLSRRRSLMEAQEIREQQTYPLPDPPRWNPMG